MKYQIIKRIEAKPIRVNVHKNKKPWWHEKYCYQSLRDLCHTLHTHFPNVCDAALAEADTPYQRWWMQMMIQKTVRELQRYSNRLTKELEI